MRTPPYALLQDETMTTPAQGNHSEKAMKPDVPFEASGLSPEEADRLAATFKPSWEFDDAPFAPGNGAHDIDLLEAGGVNSDVRGYHPDSQRSQNVAAHAPPQRVETNEPEVSVIIDRSITASEMARTQPMQAPAPVQSPFAAQMAAAALAPNRVVAPVARSRMNADESLQLPASLKKSNKGLFIGLGAAVAAAVLVFAIRAMTSSASDEPAASSSSSGSSTGTTDTAHPAPTTSPAPPPVPIPQVAATAAPTSAPVAASTSVPSIPSTPLASLPRAPAPAPAPKPVPHPVAAPPPHHAAPRPAPKQPSGGGIVRDNPF